MKKILLGAVVIAAGAAMAADSTQFGVLKVPSSAKQTIASVPWLESTTTNAAVCVSNLVLTSGLEAGDFLKYYDGSSYEYWELTEGTGGKYWQSVSQKKAGEWVESSNPATAGLARGKAIILDRCGGTDSRDLTGGFYIMGKPTSESAGTLTLPEGSSSSPAYALIAPPTTAAQDVNALTWSGLTPFKDRMIINRDGANEILTCTTATGMWGSKTHTTAGSEITIPAGKGAWFISYGEGTKTVTW